MKIQIFKSFSLSFRRTDDPQENKIHQIWTVGYIYTRWNFQKGMLIDFKFWISISNHACPCQI